MQDGCVHTAWVCAYSMEWMHILMRSSRVHWLKTVVELASSGILPLFFINCVSWGNIVQLSGPQFAHLYNGWKDDSSIFLISVLVSVTLALIINRMEAWYSPDLPVQPP